MVNLLHKDDLKRYALRNPITRLFGGWGGKYLQHPDHARFWRNIAGMKAHITSYGRAEYAAAGAEAVCLGCIELWSMGLDDLDALRKMKPHKRDKYLEVKELEGAIEQIKLAARGLPGMVCRLEELRRQLATL